MVIFEGLLITGPALALLTLAVLLFGNWYRTASTPQPAARYDLIEDDRRYPGLTVMWIDPESAELIGADRDAPLVSTLRRDR